MVKSWGRLAELHVIKRTYEETAALLMEDGDSDEPTLHEYFIDYDDRVTVGEEGWAVIEAPGLMASARSELHVLRRKAAAGISATKLLLRGGQGAWSSIDAYHAALMCLRATLGTYGIFQTSLRGTAHVFVDVFPQFADSRIVREVGEASKYYSSPCKIISRNESTIAHKAVVELFRRLFAVNYGVISLDPDVTKVLRQVDPEKYHPVRNKLLYVGGYFPQLLKDELPAPGNRQWLDDEQRDLALVANLAVCETIAPFLGAEV